MVIHNPVFDQVTLELQQLHDRFGTLKEYQRGILLHGASGTSKTFILQNFSDKYPPIYTEEQTIRPVINISITDPRIDGVLTTLLQAFGLKHFYTKKINEKLDTLINFINRSLTRLIIIDEASMIAEHSGDKTVRKSSDAIKAIINNTKTAIVCGGVDTLLKLYQSNQQFRDRFSTHLPTHAWGVGKPKTHQDFAAYTCAYAIEKGIPIPHTNAGAKIVQGLLYASDGRNRKIHELIDIVSSQYAGCDGENLQEIFIVAFRKFSKSESDVRNPFHSNFSGRELISAGELYGPESFKF